MISEKFKEDILKEKIGLAGCGNMGLPMLNSMLSKKIDAKGYDIERKTSLIDLGKDFLISKKKFLNDRNIIISVVGCGVKKYKKQPIKIKYSSKSIILKIVRLQDKLIPKFKFSFNFGLEKAIQGFFQKISDKVYEYKFIKSEEKRRKQIEENKRMQQEKAAAEKEYRLQQKQKLE